MSPQISVIVFVKNAVATIEQALQSVVSQRVPGVELLILDGGSTDGTMDVVRRYESAAAFVRSHPDGGGVHAVNEGLERARGEVIALLPADDWLEPGSLATVAREFSADPALEVLSCGLRIVTFDAEGRMQIERTFQSADLLEFKLQPVMDWPLTSARFVRRSVYQRLGRYDPAYRCRCDLDFLMRACVAGVRSRVNTQLAYTFRRHAGSLTSGGDRQNDLDMMLDTRAITAKYLARRDVLPADRQAILRLHGWACAQIAAALARRGAASTALSTAMQATMVDPLWPARSAWWFAQRLWWGAGKRPRPP